jgi:hypothetical protein
MRSQAQPSRAAFIMASNAGRRTLPDPETQSLYSLTTVWPFAVAQARIWASWFSQS